MEIISSRWLSIVNTKLDSVEELISLNRYRLPFLKTFWKIGLRSARGRHLLSFAGSQGKFPMAQSVRQMGIVECSAIPVPFKSTVCMGGSLPVTFSPSPGDSTLPSSIWKSANALLWLQSLMRTGSQALSQLPLLGP